MQVTDQNMSEPAKLRLGFHEVASYDTIEEDLGVYLLTLRSGDPESEAFSCFVFEVQDAGILNEICQCIEQNIEECFVSIRPDKIGLPSPLNARPSIVPSAARSPRLGDVQRRSKAALLVDSAAGQPALTSIVTPEAVLVARAYREALEKELSEEVRNTCSCFYEGRERCCVQTIIYLLSTCVFYSHVPLNGGLMCSFF